MVFTPPDMHWKCEYCGREGYQHSSIILTAGSEILCTRCKKPVTPNFIKSPPPHPGAESIKKH